MGPDTATSNEEAGVLPRGVSRRLRLVLDANILLRRASSRLIARELDLNSGSSVDARRNLGSWPPSML